MLKVYHLVKRSQAIKETNKFNFTVNSSYADYFPRYLKNRIAKIISIGHKHVGSNAVTYSITVDKTINKDYIQRLVNSFGYKNVTVNEVNSK